MNTLEHVAFLKESGQELCVIDSLYSICISPTICGVKAMSLQIVQRQLCAHLTLILKVLNRF